MIGLEVCPTALQFYFQYLASVNNPIYYAEFHIYVSYQFCLIRIKP
jgi:hypothetical protein